MFGSGYFMNNGYLYQQMKVLIYTAPAILIAISLHEFAHGYMSYKLGDMTPKLDGRLTLNPFRHLDIWGTLCLIFFHVGWAKPIRVNVRSYKKPKRDMVLVAAAGPLMNFLLAFLSMFLYGWLYQHMNGSIIGNYLLNFAYYFTMLNVGLGVFNLIPIPPLDGANILAELVPAVEQFYRTIRRYSVWILAAVLMSGALSTPIQIAQYRIISWMWDIVRIVLGIGAFSTGNII